MPRKTLRSFARKQESVACEACADRDHPGPAVRKLPEWDKLAQGLGIKHGFEEIQNYDARLS